MKRNAPSMLRGGTCSRVWGVVRVGCAPLMSWALLLPACQKQAAQPPVPQAASRPALHAAPLSTAAQTPDNILAILQLWSAGRKDEAIEALVTSSKSGAPATNYRPYDLTEQQFIALPVAEQNTRRGEMVATFETLRDLVRAMERRARDAAAAGDRASAEALYRAMKAVGSANMGPEVTKLAEITGKSFVKWADQGLAELSENERRVSP